jgi:hypothetical protein
MARAAEAFSRDAARARPDSCHADPAVRGLAHDWVFMSAPGELRAVIELHAAALAVQHGLDVEGELASVLSAKPTTKDA